MLEKALNLVIDPAAQKIADYLRTLIRDGDTIQVGIGQPSSLMFEVVPWMMQNILDCIPSLPLA